MTPAQSTQGVTLLTRGLRSAPAVPLLGFQAESSSDSGSEGTSDEGFSDNGSDSSDSESDEYEAGSGCGHTLRQPTSAPAASGFGPNFILSGRRQANQHTCEGKGIQEHPSGTMGLGLGLPNSGDVGQHQVPFPCEPLTPNTAPPSYRQHTGAHRLRTASTNLTFKLERSGASVSHDQGSEVRRRPTFSAHATITRSGPRSASDSLRNLVALSSHQRVAEQQTRERAGNPVLEPKDTPQDLRPETLPVSEEGAAEDNLNTPRSERTAASRRLFAALSRTASTADDGEPLQPGNRLALATPGFSSHRVGPNRPPSLEQLRLRVSSRINKPEVDTPLASTFSAGTGTPSPEWLPNTPLSSSSARPDRTPSSPSQRSVSCPTRDRMIPCYDFGGVTVTITPPTPRPQPRSPIMGYVLTNAGRPCHNIGFTRSQDDLELLRPPTFEIAPGKQKIVEDRARESLQALKAMAEAEQQNRRRGLLGDSQVQPPNAGQGQQLVGLGWPGSTGSVRFATQPSPRSRLDQHQMLGRNGGVRRASGKHGTSGSSGNSRAQSSGKYIPPALRNRKSESLSTTCHASAALASSSGRDIARLMDSSSEDEDGADASPARGITATKNGRGSTRNAGRHERWRRVENMRSGDGFGGGSPQTPRQAARQQMLRKLGQRGECAVVG